MENSYSLQDLAGYVNVLKTKKPRNKKEEHLIQAADHINELSKLYQFNGRKALVLYNELLQNESVKTKLSEEGIAKKILVKDFLDAGLLAMEQANLRWAPLLEESKDIIADKIYKTREFKEFNPK